MHPIEDISGLPSGFKRVQKGETPERARRRETGDAARTAGVKSPHKRGYKVNISETGKRLLHREAVVAGFLREIRDFRVLDDEAVAGMRHKVTTGFYRSPEVSDEVADALSALPMFQGSGPADRADNPEEPNRSALYARIREKIRNREYDRDEVIDTIVRKLMESL